MRFANGSKTRFVATVMASFLLVSNTATSIVFAETTSAPSASVSQSAAGTYVIALGDTLDITVQNHDELKTTATVLQDGTITFPEVGVIKVDGYTILKLTAILQDRLKKTIVNPIAYVAVHSLQPIAPLKVTVVGEIKTPGQYTIKEGDHLLDLIAQAGISTDNKISPETSSFATLIRADGKTSIPINLLALIQDGDLSQNLEVKAGDILIVRGRDLTASSVQVVGEVEHPAVYSLTSAGLSVASVILLAGGPTKAAQLSQSKILRNNTVIPINLVNVTKNVNDPNGLYKLLPGDVLQIPTNMNKVAILGSVTTPDDYLIPDGKNLTLSGALLLAGGPAQNADLKNGSLVRKDASGKITNMAFNVGEIMRGEGNDFAILPGDYIFVNQAKQTSVSALAMLGAVGSLAGIYNILKK